jgi:hypothetical protein
LDHVIARLKLCDNLSSLKQVQQCATAAKLNYDVYICFVFKERVELHYLCVVQVTMYGNLLENIKLFLAMQPLRHNLASEDLIGVEIDELVAFSITTFAQKSSTQILGIIRVICYNFWNHHFFVSLFDNTRQLFFDMHYLKTNDFNLRKLKLKSKKAKKKLNKPPLALKKYNFSSRIRFGNSIFNEVSMCYSKL